jgi:hypothetical protein
MIKPVLKLIISEKYNIVFDDRVGISSYDIDLTEKIEHTDVSKTPSLQ